MKKRSNYYIGVIVLLLVANLFLFISPKNSRADSNGRTYLEGYDLSQLKEMAFTNGAERVSFSKVGDRWKLNDSLEVDQGFFNTLLSILDRVQTTRRVSKWDGEIIGEIELKIATKKLKLSYGTDPNQTKSYFVNQGQVSEVSVPGYQDKVIDIFRLHRDQWRDRLVFDGSWRTIQNLTVDLYGGQDLEISFDDKFFTLNGKQPQDSSAIVEYLNQYQYFQANEVISKGRFPQLDSLTSTRPLATITLDDINYKNQLSIKIYPRLKNQNYHLVLSGDKMMVLDQVRVKNLLGLSLHSQSK